MTLNGPGMTANFPHLKYIRLQKLWNSFGQGEGKSVLVIGTGVNKVPGLEDVIELPSVVPNDPDGDESSTGHETHVISIIKTIAPKAKIYSIDAAPDPKAKLYYWVQALKRAVVIFDTDIKFDIINNSWELDVEDPEGTKAINQLSQRGVIVICATGNGGLDKPKSYANLAAKQLTLAIGSCNLKGKRSTFSNGGHDVLLPGENIKGLWKSPPPKHQTLTGTSSAAPIAAGMLACMKKNTLSWAEAKVLLNTWEYNKKKDGDKG